MRTYYKINGELSEYPKKMYPRSQATKRVKCNKCGLYVRPIYTILDMNGKLTTIGYYCGFCKTGFLDKTIGKFFSCDIIHQKKERKNDNA